MSCVFLSIKIKKRNIHILTNISCVFPLMKIKKRNIHMLKIISSVFPSIKIKMRQREDKAAGHCTQATSPAISQNYSKQRIPTKTTQTREFQKQGHCTQATMPCKLQSAKTNQSIEFCNQPKLLRAENS